MPISASSAQSGPPPKIISLQLSETDVRGGDTVHGNVVTTTNVDSVVAHLAVFSVQLPMVRAGHFAMTYTVPSIPFFFKGRYRLDVVARTTYGAEAHRYLTLTVR